MPALYRNRNLFPDPKVHGDIKGIPVGTYFYDRKHLAEAGVHGRPQWGIHGTEEDGAYAIMINGGYDGNLDKGETVTYIGQGKGQQRSTTSWEARQVRDQKWTHGNRALQMSHITKKPVRVIRGPEGDEKHCPYEGYRYDGLYEVVRVWEEKGTKGFKMCMFELQRLVDQDPLPGPRGPIRFWTAPRVEEVVVEEKVVEEPKTRRRQITEGTTKPAGPGRIPKIKTSFSLNPPWKSYRVR